MNKNEITKELRNKFSEFGALNYNTAQISTILSLTIKEVSEMMKGDLGKSYVEGKEKFNYMIDQKLMLLAQTGDLKALDKLEKRMESRQ